MRRVLQRLPVGELLRFALVGLANTVVYYVFYRLGLLALPYLAAHLIAWAISFVFSFYLNCWFTYRVRPTWKRFAMFPASAATNVGFSTFGTVLLVEWVGISEKVAPLIAGILAIPVTFLVSRWALKGKHHDDVTSADSTLDGGATGPVEGATHSDATLTRGS